MSLNFNGNYIGGIPSGGGGGGTSDHSQLTNLDFANSGHTGFMKNDASNLTTDGQKVFDGQWGFVSGYNRIANFVTYPSAENDEYDISSFLPVDNYSYLVIVSGSARCNTLDKQIRIELFSDIMPEPLIFADALCVVSKKYSVNSSAVYIPVGTQRKLYVKKETWIRGEYSLWVNGYRRIGTNS